MTFILLRMFLLHALHLGSLGYRLIAHLPHLESLLSRPELVLTLRHPKMLPKRSLLLSWLSRHHNGWLVLLLSVFEWLMRFL